MNKPTIDSAIARIISGVEKQIASGKKAKWVRPWTSIFNPPRSYYGVPYRGINLWFLPSGTAYLTANAISREGGTLNADAYKHIAVLWKPYRKEEEKDGEMVSRGGVYARMFELYDIAETSIPDPAWLVKQKAALAANKTIPVNERAEAVIADYVERSKVTIIHGNGNRAFYMPSKHWITMPGRQMFKAVEEYYSTLFHEATHSTGHESVTGRLTSGKETMSFFGDFHYSREELVAELGAGIICSSLGLESPSQLENSVQYMAGWLERLKKDPKMLTYAAGKAHIAAEWILGLVRSKEVEVKENKAKGGIEVIFASPPDDEVKAFLKEHKFRYSRAQRLWYAKFTPALYASVNSKFNPKSA